MVEHKHDSLDTGVRFPYWIPEVINMQDKNYEKYVGAQVTVEESEADSKGRTHLEVKKSDSVYSEIVKAHGDNVRVFLPGMFGTMDFDPSRLNVSVEKQVDGTFKIVNINFG